MKVLHLQQSFFISATFTSQLLLLMVLMNPQAILAEHDHHASVPAGPISIMGQHHHPVGEWMVSYSVMKMHMEGNLDGTQKLDIPLPGYMVSPLEMDMTMHMLGVMTGVSDTLNVMMMLPFYSAEMDNIVNMSGMPFTTESDGMGDLELSMLYKAGPNWTGIIGMSFPTGSIDEKDITPMSGDDAVQLAYPMQTGSGSYELITGVNFSAGTSMTGWGSQAVIYLPLDTNDRDYKNGRSLQVSAWYSTAFNKSHGTSLSLRFEDRANIKGADEALNPMMMPGADAKLRALRRVQLSMGYNYTGIKGYLIGMEVGAPVYQSLDGPQLEMDLAMQLAVRHVF